MKNTTNENNAANLHDLAFSMRQLLEATESGKSGWRDDELAEVFEHQLSAGLRDDLGLFFENVDGEVVRSGYTTFGDVLTAGHPPVALLRMIRQFAKKLSAQPDHVPGDVALALYYAAIAAAQVRAGASITSMDREDILRGYAWAHDQAWLPACLRVLFEQALA